MPLVLVPGTCSWYQSRAYCVLRLETITGDDSLIIGISMQYCDNYGSCTDFGVVAVDRGLQIVSLQSVIRS